MLQTSYAPGARVRRASFCCGINLVIFKALFVDPWSVSGRTYVCAADNLVRQGWGE